MTRPDPIAPARWRARSFTAQRLPWEGQLAADANIDGVPVLFAWPSQAELSGYVADREAVTYSRDNLVALLSRLARERSPEEITVFAHSMGGWLVIEALRRLKLQGHDDVVSRIKVVLAAPDIDENVFQSQLTVIGRMRRPITIFVSTDDVALRSPGLLRATVTALVRSTSAIHWSQRPPQRRGADHRRLRCPFRQGWT
ncbi:alpha/beta hydrolase [Mesorhizobium yinganensis]|uniref:alpha/beta hydrolase n=1 Tax=Mesorhizobium yinganensis TaxID=3157707 RepID=UPI0032B77253